MGLWALEVWYLGCWDLGFEFRGSVCRTSDLGLGFLGVQDGRGSGCLDYLALIRRQGKRKSHEPRTPKATKSKTTRTKKW